MLDDSEVDAFDVGTSCANTERMVDAFARRCGATVVPGT
jgi:hypothetical protein